MKIYISFGQIHEHDVNGVTFDKDCLAEIECNNHEHGREIAFDLFGDKWFTSYEDINEVIRYFPRGPIKAN